jgi:hypothetical protein
VLPNNAESTYAKVAKIVHQVWIDDGSCTEFLSVDWYDKPMSHNGCLKQLLELKTLSESKPLRILSFDAIYQINSPLEFCAWVQHIFEGDVDYGFSRKIGTGQT